MADAEPGLIWWLWDSFWREPASFWACYKCVWTATSPSSILTSFPPRRVTFRICRVHGGGTDAGMRSSATMSMKPWCTYPHANTCGFTYPKTIAHPDLRRTPSARRACDSPSLCRDGTLRSHRRIGHKTPPIRVEAGISIPPAVNLHIGLAPLLHDSPFQRVCTLDVHLKSRRCMYVSSPPQLTTHTIPSFFLERFAFLISIARFWISNYIIVDVSRYHVRMYDDCSSLHWENLSSTSTAKPIQDPRISSSNMDILICIYISLPSQLKHIDFRSSNPSYPWRELGIIVIIFPLAMANMISSHNCTWTPLVPR